MHSQKGAQEVHNQKVRARFISITIETVLNYQIAHCAATKVLSVLLCYRTNTTNTRIFLSNIFKLKHNQIIRIQTQKHNFKINQIITKKEKEKEKTKDRRQKSSDPSGLRWGRLFWNQVKKKRKESKSWRKRERMRVLVGTLLNEREKERKEGGDKEIRTNVDGGEKQEKKKKKKRKENRMNEMDAGKGEII